MSEDKKRRSSILKVVDRLKRNDNVKRKKVSFAPNEILLEFSNFNDSQGMNLKSFAAPSFNHQDMKENEASHINIDSLSRSPIIKTKSNIHEDAQKDGFNDRIAKPVNIVEQVLNHGNKRVRRSQVDSAMFDHSMINKSLGLRRSPRLLKRSTDNLAFNQNVSINKPEIATFLDAEKKLDDAEMKSDKSIIKLDLDDISFFSNTSKYNDPPICQMSVEMEISNINHVEQPAPSMAKTITPIYEMVAQDMDISSVKVLTPSKDMSQENKSVLMDIDSMRIDNASYSQLISQQAKEHQEKIFSISQEIRSVLSMSISECVDIINQSLMHSPSKKKTFPPLNENLIQLLKISKELKNLNEFVLCKSREISSQHNDSTISGYAKTNETLNTFDSSIFSLYSKLMENEDLKNASEEKLSSLISIRDLKANNLNKISIMMLQSREIYRLLQKIYERFKISVFQIDAGKFKIFHNINIVSYDLIYDIELNKPTFSMNIINSKDQYTGLLILVFKNYFNSQKPISDIGELLLTVFKVNKISRNFKLLYKQLDTLSSCYSCIKYDDNKIGFICHCKGVRSFIIWTQPILTENFSFSLKYISETALFGTIRFDEIIEKVVNYLNTANFEVLAFYDFLKTITDSEISSDL